MCWIVPKTTVDSEFNYSLIQKYKNICTYVCTYIDIRIYISLNSRHSFEIQSQTGS